MHKYSFFLLLASFFSVALSAQNYPTDAEPGDCFIRCPIEEISEKAKVVVTPAYQHYKVVPAVYKTVEERILIKEASKKFEYVPAEYQDVTETILMEEPVSQYAITTVKTLDTFEVFEVEPAYSRFETRPAIDGCTSPTPGDCDVICFVEHKAVIKQIPVQKILIKPAFVKVAPKEGRFRTITKRVIKTPATVREIEIPAEYITIKKRMIDKDATVDSVEVSPVEREEVFLVHDRSGTNKGFEWKKIECDLLDYNILPIYYGLNSATLNAEARDVVDEKLLKLMLKRPEIRIEINAHTDSRASDDFNMELSKQRAQGVVDYLVSKGIKRSRLEYHGYGETQLVNHCGNGVNCTEAQHEKNRRTEFRVLPR